MCGLAGHGAVEVQWLGATSIRWCQVVCTRIITYYEGLAAVARISVFVDRVGRDELVRWIVSRLTGRYVPSERVTL